MKLTDGTETELPEGEPVGSALPAGAIAARVDGELRDLSFVPAADAAVEAVLRPPSDGLHVLRHSTAHVLAQAVCDLYPGTKYAIGPRDRATASTTTSSSRADVIRRPGDGSTRGCAQIVEADQPFVREEVSRAEALERLARSAVQGARSSRAWATTTRARSVAAIPSALYRNGEWADLCLGPHVPSTGPARRVQLTNVAGAYWRGDEQRPS